VIKVVLTVALLLSVVVVGFAFEAHLNFADQLALTEGEVDEEVSVSSVEPILYSHYFDQLVAADVSDDFAHLVNRTGAFGTE